MKQNLKSTNAALNVPRRYEAVDTATDYSNTPAVDSGDKQAQHFAGTEFWVSNIYPMRSGKQFDNTLEANIHRCSAMDKPISDSAKNEITQKIKDVENLQFPFVRISYLQRSFKTCVALVLILPKVGCVHVYFTAYANIDKLN